MVWITHGIKRREGSEITTRYDNGRFAMEKRCQRRLQFGDLGCMVGGEALDRALKTA